MPLTEAEFQQQITDYCDWLHLTWHHETDSRKSKKGFPDLVIVGIGGVAFLELKSEKGKVRPDQQEWIDALKMAQGGHVAYIVRPSQWEGVRHMLHRLAGKPLPRL